MLAIPKRHAFLSYLQTKANEVSVLEILKIIIKNQQLNPKMRRKKESFIRNLYKQNTDATMACKICGKCLSTDHLGNLKSHLQRKHKSVFDGYKDDEQKISEFASVKQKILLKMSQNDVKNLCAAFITECGLPLQVFNSSAFQTLLGPICEQVNLNKINRNNISHILQKKMEIEIQYLRNFFKNKIFSIKIDSAQRLYRSVVCVNAQLLEEGKIAVKTLAVKNFKEQHTAYNLKQLILETLER